MATKVDYPADRTGLCLSVLLEVMTILGEYRNSIVVVGGWVPYFLLPEKKSEHVGSTDVDLALDFTSITDDTYSTILESLKKRSYRQVEQHPYRFIRTVEDTSGRQVEIGIDLLAGEYGGTGRSHRSQRVQDTHARKARGCDLVFDRACSVKIGGYMPSGAKNELTVKIASVVPFLVMKGNALWERLKEKDAYDIYFMISNYPGGMGSLADEFRPFESNKLALEGLGKGRAKFSGVDAFGPTAVADFLEEADPDERERIRRDVYEKVNVLLDMLGINPFEERR